MTEEQIKQRVLYYANLYGINPSIALKQIHAESGFNPSASSGEANGVAQFTPATARRFGVNVWDVESSLNGWGKYMSWLLNRYNGDYSKALAGYNAGEGNVDKYNGVPPFAETINYVRKILGGSLPISTGKVFSSYQNQSYVLTDQQASILKQGVPKNWKSSIVWVIALIVIVVVVTNWGR